MGGLSIRGVEYERDVLCVLHLVYDAVMCVSKPDITKAEKLMRVVRVFLTQCWLPAGNFR